MKNPSESGPATPPDAKERKTSGEPGCGPPVAGCHVSMCVALPLTVVVVDSFMSRADQLGRVTYSPPVFHGPAGMLFTLVCPHGTNSLMPAAMLRR